MSLLILAIVVLIVAGLAVYLIDLVPLPHPFGLIAKVLIVIVAVLVIVQRAGLV